MRAFNDDPSDSQAFSLTRDTLRHARKNSSSPYDIAGLYSGAAGANLVGNNLNPNPSDIGFSSRDNAYIGGTAKSPKSALAEAWGRADPEPFEEFSAGGYITREGAGLAPLGGASGDDEYPHYDMDGTPSGDRSDGNHRGRDISEYFHHRDRSISAGRQVAPMHLAWR